METRPSIWGECPPKFATKLGRAVVKEGQMGRFSCKVTGRPQPQVTWLKVWFCPPQLWTMPGDPESSGLDPLTSGSLSFQSLLIHLQAVLEGSLYEGSRLSDSHACSFLFAHSPSVTQPAIIHTLSKQHRNHQSREWSLKSWD